MAAQYFIILILLMWKQVEGVYDTSTTDSSTCAVQTTYGAVRQCDHCFYFAEQSRCAGNCQFDVDFDPVTFLPINGNSTCCAPTTRKIRTTTLWCYCGDNCVGKQTDDRFPGWTYEEDFKYYQATECACVDGDWQEKIITEPETYCPTYKPDDEHLRCAMGQIEPLQFQVIPYSQVAMCTQQPRAFNTVELCQQACLTFDRAQCAGVNWDHATFTCFLCTAHRVAVGSVTAAGVTHYTRLP